MTDIPIRIDLYALLIFLGVVQGIFLSYFFLNRQHRNQSSNIFLGLMLIVFSILLLDIFLCYTGYMVQVITLNDVSEPILFLIGPFIYLYVSGKLGKPFKRIQWFHFLPAVLYGFYSLTFSLQPDSYKLHAYYNAYHPELPNLSVETIMTPDPFHLQHNLTYLIFLTLIIYSSSSMSLVIKKFKGENLSFFSNENHNLAWLRSLNLTNFTILIIFIGVKYTYQHDLGDYVIASAMAISIYLISFNVIRKSVFFVDGGVTKKYEKSSLTETMREEAIKKLNKVMEEEKPFLSNTFSMPDLAKRLNMTPHHLSQIINEDFKKTFFDFVSFHRVEEAKRILSNEKGSAYKIEEIADQVGYNSKSAFNTAFKKYTGMTPSEFRSQG